MRRRPWSQTLRPRSLSHVAIVSFATFSAGCERFEPSREPGFSLPRFEKFDRGRYDRRVLLYTLNGSGHAGKWSGLYVDSGGLVWTYRFERARAAAHCDDRHLKAASKDYFDCLWDGAKLVARIDEATMAELRTHLRTIEERERVESDAEWRDGSYVGLGLTGEGTPRGKPIEIAACGTPKLYSQLTTKEAEGIIDFYWRLLRGALQWKGGSVCIGLPPTDIKEGVRGWWTPR